MASLRRQEGYLLIDHRASPGLPPSAEPTHVPGGALFESATVTCAHCHRIIVLNPDRSRARHYCPKCDHYVCDTVACVVTCDPMQAQFDRLERQALQLRAREAL